MFKKRLKQLSVSLGAIFLLLTLSGCGTSTITENSSGGWDKFVWIFGSIIKALSLGENVGVGIILFTIVIRIILLPLMHFQTKSMRKTQELQPEVKKLQAQFPGKDPESRRQLNEATQRLYAENNVNPYIGCLPLLVQMPVLMALYQAISRIEELHQGHFLWLNLAEKDPFLILPILAALFTLASSWLSMKASADQNGMTKTMTYLMPAMIFFFALSVASGISLYWTVSNAFQVIQTLMLNNPFKIQKEREEKERAEREKEKAKRKALKKALKKK
ncbi:YidC/Oxa1 family membrane protein insertase [Pilibacter termitis]|uniref:Membrane protein insertase YidC n=1 Tax=Pilibacter termitis TaxID=263852 RepID=A0A1T4Q1X8_9ENTE|nr:YidC/Oxa1 family membrane protein insertase [Pilibacter termitis]SJZ97815.1 YidC/Oxa1 family membrane protein insertase [Pilibacter termitis]